MAGGVAKELSAMEGAEDCVWASIKASLPGGSVRAHLVLGTGAIRACLKEVCFN